MADLGVVLVMLAVPVLVVVGLVRLGIRRGRRKAGKAWVPGQR